MPLTANENGQITGRFQIPLDVPPGVKRVTFLGDEGTFGEGRFVGDEPEAITATIERQVNVTPRPAAAEPLAQTFRLEQGRHVTGVDLAFKGAGTQRVVVQIREVSSGIPSDTVVTEGVIEAVNISTTSWTKASFDRPVYLPAGQEFAIVVLTNDPAQVLGIAEVGKFDAAAGQFVTSQPFTIGNLLRSSNGTSWTVAAESDLAFRLYGASFTATTRTVDLGYLFQVAPSSITRSSTTATVTAVDHGFSTGQKVVIYGAEQAAYNGAFTITVVDDDTFTFTVSGSPATPATGTLRAVAGDITDLLTLAGVERVSDATDVEFVYVLQSGVEIRGGSNARIRLASLVNEPILLRAILRGTAAESPYLFAGVAAVYGAQQQSGTYISRAFPCQAGARVSVIYEAILPGTSGITVEVQKDDESWQTVSVTSSAAVGDGWLERQHVITSFTAGGAQARVRLTLTGSVADRPKARDLRVVVI
jgi:hypothetical protein